MIVIGITGPTGSGKTTALAQLEKLGLEVVDCDALYHRMLSESESLRAALEGAFGPVFLPDRGPGPGRPGRPGVLRQGGTEPAQRHRLSRRGRRPWREGSPLAAAGAWSSTPSISSSPAWGRLCDVTVAITVPPQVRMGRIMARDGIDEERAMERIRAQKNDQYYRQHCSFLLENRAGSREEFSTLIHEFFSDLLQDMEE